MEKNINSKINIKKMAYDKFADVLYVTFSNPQDIDITPLTDADLIRTDHITKQISGITIIGFQERYKVKFPEKSNKSTYSIIDKLISEYHTISAH
ncbi:hypothetical protein KKA87_17295 [bacterium]|nr:hypothetical protein [bacterium]MBU1872100.1 hypothetical protein [bacterium]